MDVLHRDITFYNCFTHGQLFTVLSGLQADLPLDAHKKKNWADKLVDVSSQEMAGQKPCHIFYCTMLSSSETNSVKGPSVVAISNDGATLTGAAAAIAVFAILNQQVLPGVGYFASSLPPEDVMGNCVDLNIFSSLIIEDSDSIFDEGEL